VKAIIGMAITISGLRFFVAVAESGNIASAADAQGRSISAISMALKKLEEELGGPLFETDRKTRLTELGRYTFENARACLRRYDLAIDNIRAFASGATGRLEIACVPSVASYLLPEMISEFLRAYPNVHLDIRDIDTASIEKAVVAGEVDFGIAGVPQGKGLIDFTPLFEDRFVLVCQQSDPIANKQKISWRSLAKQKLIANGASARVEDPKYQNIVNDTVLMVRNMTSLLALVRRGVGVTVLPYLSIPENDPTLTTLTISDDHIYRSVGIYRRAGEELSPTADAFLTILHKYISGRIKEEVHIKAPVETALSGR